MANIQPTLYQRLMADSPNFFKKAELFGLFLIGLSAAINQIPGVPQIVAIVVGSVGATLSVISKFAVKDITALNNPNATLQDYTDLAKDLGGQIAEVKANIKTTIDTVKNPPVAGTPASEIPIVTDAPIVIPKKP